MAQAPPPDYRQHLALETPEHVALDYELAGVGSRVAAALADWAIIATLAFIFVIAVSLMFAAPLGAGALVRRYAGWLMAGVVALLFGIVWSYFTLFEGLRNGQTPGKRMLGIRTIRDTGHGITVAEAAARNLLLPVDLVGMVGLLLIALHPKGKRLGDFVAGTVVVRDRPIEVAAPSPAIAADGETPELGSPELEDEEFRLLRAFIARAPALPAAVQQRLAGQLAARFAERYPGRPPEALAFLTQLHADELARRRGRYGARGASSRSVAERLIARKGGRWDEFQVIAQRVTRSGLDVLSAAELPDFAARYREVAADLARARTYGADPKVLAQLERLAASGHAALYRDERQTWRRIWRFFSHDCPRGVLQSWRYVALAYLVFFVPAGAGYALLRERPSLAPELIPDVMLERAEAGAARMAKGQGYVLEQAGSRPAMATEIMTNNIRVAFNCFAGGVVLGVGSLVMVGYNGLMLGATSGYYADVGMLGYLWTFVVGHGVLEITAICFAGAAGLMLGLAIIAPGQRTRSDALALAGGRAMRLVGMVVVLLVIAGTIEGFISSSGMTLAGRAAVSAGSALFLLAYLYNGRDERRDETADA